MECPYCRGELEPGTLSLCARDPSFWMPRGTKLLFYTKKKVEKAGGFRVPAGQGVRSDLEAWYCRTCKRMILFDVK